MVPKYQIQIIQFKFSVLHFCWQIVVASFPDGCKKNRQFGLAGYRSDKAKIWLLIRRGGFWPFDRMNTLGLAARKVP